MWSSERSKTNLRQPASSGSDADERVHPVVLVEDVPLPAPAGGVDVAAGPVLPVVHDDPVQGGDPFGGQHRRVRPGHVLVEAGGEGEAVPAEESRRYALFQTTSRKVRKIGRSAAVNTPAPSRANASWRSIATTRPSQKIRS